MNIRKSVAKWLAKLQFLLSMTTVWWRVCLRLRPQVHINISTHPKPTAPNHECAPAVHDSSSFSDSLPPQPLDSIRQIQPCLSSLLSVHTMIQPFTDRQTTAKCQ